MGKGRGGKSFERKGPKCELKAPGVKKVGRGVVPHFPQVTHNNILEDNIEGPGLRLGSDG